MNWFAGNIAEAVALSKAKNSIFVVYCEGSDEMSTSFSKLINDEIVRRKLESEDFVAIKVQSDSEAYMQFAAIYKLVPLPSMFFIGKNGAPIEIVTGVTKTVDELSSKIDGVLNGVKPKPASSSSATASADLIANEQSVSNEDSEVVCENGVCYKRPKQNKTETATSSAGTSSDNSSSSMFTNEEKLARAKELIEKKRIAKEEEEAHLAKERELNRRRIGQELQNFKQRQEENEFKKLQEERKRDKIEEQAARKRILEQIALDKAERAKRFNTNIDSPKLKQDEASNTSNLIKPIMSDSAVARIQFKKPNGEIDVKTFEKDLKFSVVRSYVDENIISSSSIRQYTMATTFPRHEFNADDNTKSLLDLGLVPSSVILILPLDKTTNSKLPLTTSYGIFSMLTTIFWGLVSPMLAAFTYAKNLIFSRNRNGTGTAKRANEEELNHNEQAKKRILRFDKQSTPMASVDSKQKDGPYKRVGGAGSNIHRLSDTKDSDDENNTWNGNSTQQQ